MYVQVDHVTKTINKIDVLKDINIRMQQNNVYGIKGKNGSGKTMLMRVICGLILPTKGKVIINDEVLGKDISFPRSIGVLIENPGFVANLSGFNNLKLLANIQKNIHDEEISRTMEMVGLNPTDTKSYKKYSLGMKQKLGIAASIMENPDVIILDEPFNALDEKSVNKTIEILLNLKSKNKIIIIACHDSEELEQLSDEVFFMDNGEIINHDIKVNQTVSNMEANNVVSEK